MSAASRSFQTTRRLRENLPHPQFAQLTLSPAPRARDAIPLVSPFILWRAWFFKWECS
jgi:hypothetical protein